MSQGAKKPFTLIADAVSGATRRTLRQINSTKEKIRNKYNQSWTNWKASDEYKKAKKNLCKDQGKGC